MGIKVLSINSLFRQIFQASEEPLRERRARAFRNKTASDVCCYSVRIADFRPRLDPGALPRICRRATEPFVRFRNS
jgi:hypothetical protein